MTSTAAIASITALPSMDNAALEDLLDAIVEGRVSSTDDLGDLYDAALTERYREGRADRVAVLPLKAEPAPDGVLAFLF